MLNLSLLIRVLLFLVFYNVIIFERFSLFYPHNPLGFPEVLIGIKMYPFSVSKTNLVKAFEHWAVFKTIFPFAIISVLVEITFIRVSIGKQDMSLSFHMIINKTAFEHISFIKLNFTLAVLFISQKFSLVNIHSIYNFFTDPFQITFFEIPFQT